MSESFSREKTLSETSIWSELGLPPPPTPRLTPLPTTKSFLFESPVKGVSITQKDLHSPTKPAPTMTTPRIGGSKKLGSEEILFSGGGSLQVHRIHKPLSSMAYRLETDIQSIMRVEDACTRPIDDTKRIDEGSSVVTFTQWTNEVKRHFIYNGLDSIAYVLKAKKEGAALPDINNLQDVEKECYEYNLFTEWGVLTREDMDAWDMALETSMCPMDATNNTYARRFLRSSVGPVLRERIDRELPIDVSGARLLFFIIRKLQAVSAISGRQLVQELQKIKLTSIAGYHVQDCSQQIHNVCTKLVGLGPSHVPSDLAMLVALCFDTTDVQAFDFEVTNLQNDLDNNSASHSWTSILDHLNSKFDKLVLTKRWPPLSSEHGRPTGISGFAVQLEEVKKGLKDVKFALAKDTKDRNHAKSSTERDFSNVECNYCHKKGHYKSSCPVLAMKQNNEKGNEKPNDDKGEKQKHWTRTPPTDSESPIKSVTVEGKTVTFKWCKNCRRWRSGPKAHLTEDHKRKASSGHQQNGNVLQQQTGINFGLFAGETHLAKDGMLPGGCLETFYKNHPILSTDDEDKDDEWKVVGTGAGTPFEQAQQVHPKELAGRW